MTQTTPEGANLEKEYALRFSGNAHYRTRVWRVLIEEYFQTIVGQDRVLLDLGSGWGEFINNVRAREKFAMDLNPEGRSRIAEDVTFLEQDCSATWPLSDESLDVVFTSNFFEHLPTRDSLLDTLRQAHRCLRKGGRILCMGPNIRYVGGAYWDFFDHHLALTHVSLAEALRMADFEVTRVIPRFLPYTMADGKQPPLFAVRMYLRHPLAWPIFGRQFLVVAEKRS